MDTIDRIFELMKKNNITATNLAKELNLSVPTFSQWKKGLQNPSAEAVTKIAKYFNVSTDYLLGLTDNPEPTNERAPAILEKAEALRVAATNILGHEPTENDLEKFKELAEVFFKKFDEKSK